ncbi:Zinc knuckle family protein [Aphelenchoides avenae]|nr:Zinc knuckle family protein [Aphelenchus avenae]
MSWMQRFLPAWKIGSQDTTPEDRRSQNACEVRSLEYQQHFSHHASDEARQTAKPSDMQLQSNDDHQCQTQLRATHRITAPFQRDPFSCATTTYSRRTNTYTETTHSVDPVRPAVNGHNQYLPLEPTRSVGPANAASAQTTHSVAAVRPVADRSSFPFAVRFNSSSETVLLPTVHHTGHHGSSTTSANGLQPDRTRDPVPTATFADQLGATHATSQGATATTAVENVKPAAAGGEGPTGSPPEGPTNDSEEDKTAKSTFYRNGRFTRRTLPNGQLRSDLVMEKLPLRPFDGDVRKYHQFRDDFLSLMEPQAHLGPSQKLQHLLEHLQGRPRSMAEGYGICEEAYWNVLDMLEDHFGDNTVIQNVLVQDFVDIQPPTELRMDLEKFLQEATTIQKRLKRSGIDLDEDRTYNLVLMGHLPVQLRIKLIQSYGCRGAKKISCVLDGLRQYLSDIKEAEEHALPLRKPCEPAEDPTVLQQHQPGNEATGAHLASCEERQQDTPSEVDVDSVTQSVQPAVNEMDKSSDDRLKEIRACQLCNMESHVAANCLIYPTIQKRLRRVLKLQICLLCLRGGHQAKSCPKRKKQPCKICGHGQHHRIPDAHNPGTKWRFQKFYPKAVIPEEIRRPGTHESCESRYSASGYAEKLEH